MHAEKNLQLLLNVQGGCGRFATSLSSLNCRNDACIQGGPYWSHHVACPDLRGRFAAHRPVHPVGWTRGELQRFAMCSSAPRTKWRIYPARPCTCSTCVIPPSVNKIRHVRILFCNAPSIKWRMRPPPPPPPPPPQFYRRQTRKKKKIRTCCSGLRKGERGKIFTFSTRQSRTQEHPLKEKKCLRSNRANSLHRTRSGR